MKRVDDFRLRLGKHELVPIMIGGMGVDISTADLALEAARLGGVGHISDAMINTVSDRRYETKHVKEKLALYKYNVLNEDKSPVKFDLGRVEEATKLHVEATMARKRGDGLVFINDFFAAKAGDFLRVRVLDADEHDLYAEIVDR